ncbi:MAG: hypothetical protein HQL14_06385 [Candidatus Omnitrophica bacterium]|nr:hypothetical protein [Candidatus Omnitrophota bacterium]
MANGNFMSRVKQWDNRAAQWMSRHFYIILFEAILAVIFIMAFINALRILDSSFDIHKDAVIDRLLLSQSINTTLIVMLLLLISLGVLNIINTNSRLRGTLKNIEFNLSRRRSDHKPQDD